MGPFSDHMHSAVAGGLGTVIVGPSRTHSSDELSLKEISVPKQGGGD